MRHAVHLTSVHYAYDPRIFHKQLTTLADSGYKTTLICHHDKSLIRNNVYIDALEDTDHRIKRWKDLYAIAKRARQKQADIYHFHDPELLPVGWYLSIQTDAKIVYDVHEDYLDAIEVREWIPEQIKPFLLWLFPKIESKIVNSIDFVITADKSTHEKMAKRVNVPVETIRNFPKIRKIPEKKLNIAETKENILAYVGGLDRERGLIDMLRLTAELVKNEVEVCLWLIGEFQSEEIEREARDIIDSAGISNNIRLFGYIDYEDIFSYLKLADIGLLLADTSRFRRNVPTKFFEYLYCGLPVILTEINSLSEYVDRSYCTVVPNEDSQAIVSSVIKLLSDDDRLSEMGEHGRKVVESEYCWEVESKKLLEVYNRLLV